MRRAPLLLIALFCAFFARAAVAEMATNVALGPRHGCALYEDGSVWCWGAMIGEPAASAPAHATRVAGLPPAIAIASGGFGSCAIDRDHALWCWGLDYAASFQAKTLVSSRKPFRIEGLPRVRAVALGYAHACVVTDFGKVMCWGENPCGELGCGDRTARARPEPVPDISSVVSISAGVNKTCVVMRGGVASCWGSDNPTMPGRPFVFESPSPLVFDETIFGRFRTVAAGRNFVCGLRVSGKVTCWGSNIMTQLGTDTPRKEDWGGGRGLGEVDGISHASTLAAGLFDACAVQDGKLYCWGVGYGAGEATTREEFLGALPTVIPGLAGVTRISLGEENCVVARGRVLCWRGERMTREGEVETLPPDPQPVPGLPDR